jgi:hypothetical protein
MMGWKEWTVGALLAVLCLVATVASAAPQCGPRASVLEQLADRYGEARRCIGPAANGMVAKLDDHCHDAAGADPPFRWSVTDKERARSSYRPALQKRRAFDHALAVSHRYASLSYFPRS